MQRYNAIILISEACTLNKQVVFLGCYMSTGLDI